MSKFVLTAQLQLQGPTNVRQVVNQIQSQLGKGVSANVSLQGGPQAQRQLQQITKESNKATTAASNMGKALGVSIRRFTGLAIATRAVSLFTNTLGAAVREGIAFERELIKISQVTGKSLSQLDDLTDTIRDLSTGLGVTSTSLLQTSRILSQAGFSAQETEIGLEALAKTTLAPTFDDISRTAEGAVAIFNQFGQGAAALEGQLGSLNAVAGKFAVESGDLISTIRRTGGVFKAAGGDLNELIALFTSVRSTTRESAESIATGLRTILTRIQRPRTIEYLKQYGVELETLEGKFVGPFEAVKRLSQATAGLEQGDLRFIEIAEEIAGFRQIGKVIPLLREFRISQEALAVAQGGVNSLTEDAASAQAALAVRITKVKEEFLALVRSVTETATFQLMASTVLSLAESLIRLGEAIKPVLPLLTALVGIRALKGLGNFAGGIGKGLSARGFASGGMVPGSGNRDTVPAMLTPGEFVIKKTSVAKLGASNLEAMNNNRYAKGGVVVDSNSTRGFASGGVVPGTGSGDTVPATLQAGDFVIRKRSVQSVGVNNLHKMSGYAAGGSVSESVPAMLTPGEFVFPKQQAQKIGYGKLNRMNKVGKYANGGVVLDSDDARGFASGGTVPSTDNSNIASAVLTSGEFAKRKSSVTSMGAENFAPISKYALGGSVTAKGSKLSKAYPSLKERVNPDQEYSANVNAISVPTAKVIRSMKSRKKNQPSKKNWQLFEESVATTYGLRAAGGNSYLDYPDNNGEAKFLRANATYASDKETGFIKGNNNETMLGKLVGQGKYRKGRTVNVYYPQSLSQIQRQVMVQKDSTKNSLSKRAKIIKSGLPFKKMAIGGEVTGADSVPAMTTPGEFVIKKSNVAKMGASNLKAMNNNRYAKGGIVVKPGAIGGFFLSPEQGDPRSYPIKDKISVTNRRVLERTGHLEKGSRVQTGSIEQFFLASSPAMRQKMLGRGSKKPNQLVSNTNAKSVKSLVSKGMSGDTNQQTAARTLQKDFNDPKVQRRINKERRKAQTQAGAKKVNLSGSITGYFPGRNDLENSSVANQVRQVTKQVIYDGVISAAQSVGNTLNAGVSQISLNQSNLNAGAKNASNDLQTLSTTEGYLFEGIINALTGAKLAGGKTRFDFPSSSIGSAKSGLKQLFTNNTGEGVDSLIKADAKRTASTGSFNSIIDKLTFDINAGRLEGLSFTKFASGGVVKNTYDKSSTKKIDETSSENVVSQLRRTNLSEAITRNFADSTQASSSTSTKDSQDSQSFAKKAVGSILSSFDKSSTKKIDETSSESVVSQLRRTNLSEAITRNFADSTQASSSTSTKDSQDSQSFAKKAFSNIVSNLSDTSSRSKDLRLDESSTSQVNTNNIINSYLTKDIQKFASGGAATGTDTVPAMLTPGEFVVNKQSAKSIGYSNLKRMNQVGKYAAGGIVTPNRHAYGNAPAPMGAPGSIPGMAAGPALQKVANSAQQASTNIDKTGNSALFLGASALAVQTGLSALRPNIDENSSAFKKNVAAIVDAGQGLIGIVTTVGIALQTFGIQLNAANLGGVFDLITSGTGKFVRPLAKVGINLAKTLGGNARTFAKLAVGAGRLATGLGIATVATSALKGLSDSFFDFDNRLQKAISEGNVEKAGAIARSQQTSDAAFGAVGGAATGAAIGSLFGPVGTAVGAVAGGLYGLLTAVDATKVSFAEARARLAKSNIDLKSATDQASKSLEEFKTNADAASRQRLSQDVTKAQSEIIKSSKSASTAIGELSQDQSRVVVGSKVTSARQDDSRFPALSLSSFFGPRNNDTSFMRSTGENDAQIKQIQEESVKALREGIQSSQAGVDAIIKDVALRGGGRDEMRAAGVDPESLFKAANEAFSESVKAQKRGDKVAQAAALERAAILREEGQRQEDASNNQIQAINDLINKMKTFSLSLSQATAAANAANVSLSNLQSAFDPSKSGLQNSINTLESSTTSAARGMSNAQFESALNSASEAMITYGASAQAVDQFRTNLTGVASAQKELPSIIARVDDEIKATGSIDPASQLRTFTSAIDQQLKGSGVDASTRKAFTDALGADLSDEERSKVLAGGTAREKVFEDRLSKLGDTVNQDAIPAIKAIAENDEKLANVLNRRIQSENNLINAQQQAIDVFLEARQLEASFGGAPVSLDERRRTAAARSNVLGRTAGLSDIGGDVGSLRRRREEIRAGFAATQSRRSQILAGGGAASAAEKTALTGQEDRLKQAQQEQLKTIRDLIKIQQDEIKTIQEKTRLEKESIDSLLAGNIDKFFEQQAAQGAIAAAATGSTSLIGAFGADATGAAAQELQRLQAAGVQEVFGQQIGGAGGLAETTALAGLQQRGITGQAGLRAAQISAGTTPELEAAKATGRALAEELAAAGDLGADMASDELSVAAQALQQAANDISNAINQSGASTQRGVLTGQSLQNQRQVATQQSIVNDAQKAAIAKEEQATRAQAEFNKSKFAGMSNQDLMALPTDEYNQAMQMKAAARFDLPREAEAARGEATSAEALLRTRQLQGETIQRNLDAAGPAGFSVGGFSGRILSDTAASSSATLPSVMPTDTSSSSLLLPLAAGRNLAGELGEAEGRRRGEESLVGAGGIGAPSSSLLLQGVLAEGRNLAGQLGEEEGRRRGKESLGGFGGLLGGGNIGAARGRETAEQQFDNIFSGLDEQSSETLNNFSDSVKALQGMEVAHKLGDMNINLGGLDFLKDMKPEIQNNVIESIQKELENYRPTSTGMSKNNSVLPKST